MTKEEIYEYLNFQGKYDANVKKRLKKLIKKYHPDLNNGDDTTIKIINEVKKELETGNFIYAYQKSKTKIIIRVFVMHPIRFQHFF